MTARGRHALGAALLSGVLVVLLVGAAWLSNGPRGARPESFSPPAKAGPPAATATGDGSAPPGSAPASSASSSASARPSTTVRATTEAAAAPTNAAQRLRTLPAQTRQVVIVTTDSFASNTAVLETYEKVNGTWRAKFASMTARIGQAGFADRKAEGDLKTPTGMYSIDGTMYGIAANPGVKYGYHRLVPDDWWNENPATPGYNTFFHGANPGGASEALWTISPQYRYFAVINYNFPVVSADPPRGSGIFLHVMNPGKATAGCVSLNESDLLAVLRWLDPASAPRMVLAPRTVLSRF